MLGKEGEIEYGREEREIIRWRHRCILMNENGDKPGQTFECDYTKYKIGQVQNMQVTLWITCTGS